MNINVLATVAFIVIVAEVGRDIIKIYISLFCV